MLVVIVQRGSYGRPWILDIRSMICIKGGEGVAGLGYWFSWFKKILGSSISEKNDGTVAGISLISHTNFNLPLSELGSCDWRIHHYRGNAPREKWVIQLQSKEPRREPDYQDRRWGHGWVQMMLRDENDPRRCSFTASQHLLVDKAIIAGDAKRIKALEASHIVLCYWVYAIEIKKKIFVRLLFELLPLR